MKKLQNAGIQKPKAGKLSFQGRFLSYLNLEESMSNSRLKELLKWPDERYDKIKAELKEKGKIVIGAGQGGPMKLTKNAVGTSTELVPLKAFLSYSHADKSIKNELMKHLMPLQRQGLLEVWHDHEILAGENLDEKISSRLAEANVILLLVSADFINSNYCYNNELGEALLRHSRQEISIIPIIARACLWDTTPFASLKAIPLDGKAISSWSDRDEALKDVANSIRKVANERLSASNSSG